MIGQLVRAKLRDDDIVACVGGMMAAGAGFAKTFTHAVHELIAHRKMSDVANALPDSQATLLCAQIREALRFRPVFPFLIRYCPRATLVRDGNARPLQVSAGSTLKISPLMAMFDATVVDQPEMFIAGRPSRIDYVFGGGSRVCIGEEMVMAMFQPMMRELLKHVPSILDAEVTARFCYDSFAVEKYTLRPPHCHSPEPPV